VPTELTALRRKWRRVLAIDLGLFSISMFSLMLIPPAAIIGPEMVGMAGAAGCLLLVVSHAFFRFRIPGEEWGYFATGLLGTSLLLGFFNYINDERYLAVAPDIELKVPVALFLLSGVASAFAAHVIDGGRNRLDHE
jgi:hypothetical protein